MPLDLDKFKGKPLEGEMLSELQAAITAHVDAEVTPWKDKAKKAERESIEGRKAKDQRIERLSELLGVDPDADLEKIDVKGMAEAQKQVEQQLKRVTRERDEAVAARDKLTGEVTSERRSRAIATEISKHPFVDADDVTALIERRIKAEGDELFVEVDGKPVSLADGVAWVAKTKPHLVRPTDGSGGSGYQSGTRTGAANVPGKAPERKDFANEVDFFKAAAKHSASQQAA